MIYNAQWAYIRTSYIGNLLPLALYVTEGLVSPDVLLVSRDGGRVVGNTDQNKKANIGAAFPPRHKDWVSMLKRR